MGCNGSKNATAKPPQTAPTLSQQPAEPAEPVKEQTPEERAMTQLKVIYESTDVNKDGCVDKKELSDAMKRNEKFTELVKEAGLNADFDSSTTFDGLDTNTDGKITWDEFVEHLKTAAVKEVKDTGNVAGIEKAADEKALEQLQAVFKSLDTNADGAVDSGELTKALNANDGLTSMVVEAGFNPDYYVLEQLDTNNDGVITWDEFEKHFRAAAKAQVQDTGEMAAVVPEVIVEGEEMKTTWCC